MQYIVMHATEAKWEAGEKPSAALAGNVGAFIGELAKRGAFLGGEGLRATSLGARLSFKDGRRKLQRGPYVGERELAAGFVVVRVPSLDDAIEWATRFADAVGDVELDVRPVTEPWDVGFAPVPETIETTRFMVLHKADAETERGFSRGDRERVRRLLEASRHDGTLLLETNFLPSAKGKRVVRRAGALQVLDGPFAESKEMLAGYTMFEAASLEEATEVARRYVVAVESAEAELREVSTTPTPRSARDGRASHSR